MVSEERPVWVGLLDVDKDGPVVGISGPPRIAHQQARVLVRIHGAPLGYVYVSSVPIETLSARARMAAEAGLSEAMLRHAQCYESIGELHGSNKWGALAGCPSHFPPGPSLGVTIVVCTRDRTKGLCECLSALLRTKYEPIEIIVVDNAPSGDETRRAVAEIAHQDQRIRYTCEPSPGLSRARNHGITQARYDIVAFTDDDTLVDSGWPSAVAAGFAVDPETVCVTGLVASSELDTGAQRYFDSRYSWGEAFEPRRYDLGAYRHSSKLYPFSAGIFGTGANFAVRRSVIASIGGFDPLLGAGGPGRGGEDLDIFLRVILAGGRICYLPSALVWHRHRADTVALGEQIYSYGYGLGAYLAKHLMNRQLRAGLLGQGLRQAFSVARRMRRATEESQLRAGGSRLGFMEAMGVMAGALCYYRVSRRSSGLSTGAP